MTKLRQSIKNIGLFLFGIVVIVLGYKANVAHAQTKSEVVEVKAPEVAEKGQAAETYSKATDSEDATPKKSKTTLEKAKPERAHASKGYKKKSGAKKPHGPRK